MSGLVTSLCQAVSDSDIDKLLGVVCVDMTISDLFSDVTYFRQGELSYSFITDQNGRVITHPLLPRPMSVEEDPIFVRLTALEIASEASVVMNAMQRSVVNAHIMLVNLS